MDRVPGSRIGIAGIAVYEPRQELANGWFGDRLARKFVQHTGTTSRRISQLDEVAMGLQAVANLRSELRVDLRECAGLIFVSPSYLPAVVATKYLDPQAAGAERLRAAARRLARRLGVPPGFIAGMNWFCSGYAKAMSAAARVATIRPLRPREYLLIVTATRISRITDFDCPQTAPLFGDLATATVLARGDSPRYPVHYALLSASAQKEPAPGAFFDFAPRENVLVPADDGGQERASRRVVFSLDGLGIADVAPRAMAAAVERELHANSVASELVRHIVPHQAGTGIVRLASMKLEQAGIGGEVLNGITGSVGNVSSSSIPYALKQSWGRLSGLIACPTAAVGSPGRNEVSSGCILLQATRLAERSLKRTA